MNIQTEALLNWIKRKPPSGFPRTIDLTEPLAKSQASGHELLFLQRSMQLNSLVGGTGIYRHPAQAEIIDALAMEINLDLLDMAISQATEEARKVGIERMPLASLELLAFLIVERHCEFSTLEELENQARLHTIRMNAVTLCSKARDRAHDAGQTFLEFRAAYNFGRAVQSLRDFRSRSFPREAGLILAMAFELLNRLSHKEFDSNPWELGYGLLPDLHARLLDASFLYEPMAAESVKSRKCSPSWKRNETKVSAVEIFSNLGHNIKWSITVGREFIQQGVMVGKEARFGKRPKGELTLVTSELLVSRNSYCDVKKVPPLPFEGLRHRMSSPGYFSHRIMWNALIPMFNLTAASSEWKGEVKATVMGDYGGLEQICHYVANDLLEPILPSFKGHEGCTLTICPDWAMYSFPMHLLPTKPAPWGDKSWGGETLLDRHPIYFSTSLFKIPHVTITASPRVRILADPKLPGGKKEYEVLTKIYGTESVTYHDCSHSSLTNLRSLWQGVDILHISLHGDPEKGLEINGDFLSAETIRAITTDAQLVFLSSCHAGHVRNVDDVQGPSSMALAFLECGAAYTVAPFWRIQDEVAPLIAENFYRQLSVGKDVSTALRIAQLLIRDLTREELEAKGLHIGDGSARPLSNAYFWGAWAAWY